jgi:hypothetical protein
MLPVAPASSPETGRLHFKWELEILVAWVPFFATGRSHWWELTVGPVASAAIPATDRLPIQRPAQVPVASASFAVQCHW